MSKRETFDKLSRGESVELAELRGAYDACLSQGQPCSNHILEQLEELDDYKMENELWALYVRFDMDSVDDGRFIVSDAS